jgi:hypothetical protein
MAENLITTRTDRFLHYAMKRHITFFLLVSLAAALVHFLAVLGLTQVVVSNVGILRTLLSPVLWLLLAPMNFLLLSPFGQTLSPTVSQLLFFTNSLFWGIAVGAVFLWRRFRYE